MAKSKRSKKSNKKQPVGYFANLITVDDVRALKPDMIFYGARTCWWTHDPGHLSLNRVGLPCDPRGGVLFQTDDVEGFLAAAEENPEHYGRHGLRAFEAAHHLNCRVNLLTLRPTCFEDWEPYNAVLDRFDAEQKARGAQ